MDDRRDEDIPFFSEHYGNDLNLDLGLGGNQFSGAFSSSNEDSVQATNVFQDPFDGHTHFSRSSIGPADGGDVILGEMEDADALLRTAKSSTTRTSYKSKREIKTATQGAQNAIAVNPNHLHLNAAPESSSRPKFEALGKLFGLGKEKTQRMFDHGTAERAKANDDIAMESFSNDHLLERSPSSSTGSAAGSLSMESTRSTESSLGTSISAYPRRDSDLVECIPESNDKAFASLSAHPPFNHYATLETAGEDTRPLTLRILGIPTQGAKTRVETQVKLTVQLVDRRSGTIVPETGYTIVDGTGSSHKVIGWRHFKIPPHLAAKSTRRKAVAAEEVPQEESLQLRTEVICASTGVFAQACDACVVRERKRFFRRKAARTRPMKDSAASRVPEPDEPTIAKHERDKIIMFSTGEVLDIPSGECEVPVRFTCYCRHHQERSGFLLKLSAIDWKGNIIAEGKTPPIMITDDHKSMIKGSTSEMETTKRTHHIVRRASADGSKASDSDHSASNSRPVSVKASRRKGATTPRSLAMTPCFPALFALPVDPTDDKTDGSAPAPGLPTPISSPTNIGPVSPGFSLGPQHQHEPNAGPQVWNEYHNFNIGGRPDIFTQSFLARGSNLAASPWAPQPESSSYLKRPASVPNISALAHGTSNLQSQRSPAATISALIPSEGPVSGGQPISIIGVDLTPELTVMFGDIPAVTLTSVNSSSMVVWLPPSPIPGPVVVTLRETSLQVSSHPNEAVQIFTYQDHTDRDLMQLALQVIGVSMTGQLQDAHQIAQRIISGGQNSQDDSSGNLFYCEDMQMSEANLINKMCTGDPRNFEALVIRSLSLLDRSANQAKCINLQNKRGQTLMHLAAQLGYLELSIILQGRDIQMNVQDNNGFTALHFAAWAGKYDIVRALTDAGLADEIRTKRGHLAIDLARELNHRSIWMLLRKAWEFEGECSLKSSGFSFDQSQNRPISRRISISRQSTVTSDSEDGSIWIGYTGDDDLSSEDGSVAGKESSGSVEDSSFLEAQKTQSPDKSSNVSSQAWPSTVWRQNDMPRMPVHSALPQKVMQAHNAGSQSEDHALSDQSSVEVGLKSKLQRSVVGLPGIFASSNAGLRQSARSKPSPAWLRTLRADRMLWLFHVPILLFAVVWILLRYSNLNLIRTSTEQATMRLLPQGQHRTFAGIRA